MCISGRSWGPVTPYGMTPCATELYVRKQKRFCLTVTRHQKYFDSRNEETATDLMSAVRGSGVTQSQLPIIAASCRQEDDRVPPATLALLRAKQAETLRALRRALIANGIDSVEDQARVLGLPRSTTWFILQSNHKWRGLNAAQVVRMLQSQRLPEEARRVVIRYVVERVEGAYGHTQVMRRKFVARLERLGWAAITQQPKDQARRHSVLVNP
jgi:hypothetical protein